MDGSGIVAALLDREQVDDAIVDLESHGVADERIEVSPAAPGQLPLAEEAIHEEIRGLERGVALGAMVGILVGLAAVAAPFPDFGETGAAGYLIGAFGGGLFGALIGALGGVMARDRMDDAEQRWVEVDEDDPRVLVIVRSAVLGPRAHRILERHGATFLDGTELSHSSGSQAPGA